MAEVAVATPAVAPTVAPARGGRWYGREEAGSNTSGIGAWWLARVLPAVAAHHGVPAADKCVTRSSLVPGAAVVLGGKDDGEAQRQVLALLISRFATASHSQTCL